MDLTSGYPYWVVKNGLLSSFPALREDVRCDVLVVGAGITGALIAYRLARAGIDVCVIDRREAGWGSTAASTALLQYENDVELQDMVALFGESDAVLAYRSCEQAIPKLLRLARQLGGIDAQPMHSLYYASKRQHKSRLLKEAALRQLHGFQLSVLDSDEVRKQFGFDAPVALLTSVAAEIDPYQMTHRLLAEVQRLGGHVFDRSAMLAFKARRRGVVAHLDNDVTIRCGNLIIAAGYESQQQLDQIVASNRSSYAFVTDPIPEGLGPLEDCLIWESARPYLYMRRTGDGRLLVGGEDDKIDIPLKRDASVARKAEKLRKRSSALFPNLSITEAFAWAGTFAETRDGLPFFGPHEQHGPHVHFAMAYGGNGITYSLIGAELLRDRIQGRRHPCSTLFSFDRLKRA